MCRKCGKPVLTAEVYRTTVCADCGADLHSCINCKYYAPGSHYDCHETVDELVSDFIYMFWNKDEIPSMFFLATPSFISYIPIFGIVIAETLFIYLIFTFCLLLLS